MVVWYVGSSEKQNSSFEFNLGFKYEDNDQQIYCKAVNILGAEVWSTKPKLYVQGIVLLSINSLVLRC